MKLKNLKSRFFTSFFLLFLLFLIFKNNFLLAYCLIVLGSLSMIEFFDISKRIYKSKIFLSFINLLFIFYIFLFCFLFFLFSSFFHLKIILFAILLGCVASDIGGYLFGKFFKGPKLTKISPNKTYSGSIGSIVLSCIIISLVIFYYTQNFNYRILLISISTSLFCQLGDLFFSFLKRKAKIKDTGNFLPGHGGVLDRIDGILLGLPLGFIILTLLF